MRFAFYNMVGGNSKKAKVNAKVNAFHSASHTNFFAFSRSTAKKEIRDPIKNKLPPNLYHLS